MLAVAGLSATAVAVTGGQSNGSLSVEDGLRLERKIAQILERDQAGGTRQRLVVLEQEINAYLRYQGASQLPVSVTLPRLTIKGGGRVRAEVTIDLDLLRESRERGVLDLLSYLGGKVPVVAEGLVTAADGSGSVTIEGVEIAGVSVPPSVLLQLVRFYTRGESYPDGFDLAAPFELPYGILEVSVEVGRAIVVQ